MNASESILHWSVTTLKHLLTTRKSYYFQFSHQVFYPFDSACIPSRARFCSDGRCGFIWKSPRWFCSSGEEKSTVKVSAHIYQALKNSIELDSGLVNKMEKKRKTKSAITCIKQLLRHIVTNLFVFPEEKIRNRFLRLETVHCTFEVNQPKLLTRSSAEFHEI